MRIAVASPIGGCGRTTLVLNLALALCDRGLRVLMIDVDPQGCLGFLLARKDDEWLGLADFLMGRVNLEKAVKRSNVPLLSLLPRGRLDPADVCEYERAIHKPRVLDAGLRNLDRNFDVLLLDLPPGTGQVPRGALAISTEVLVAIRAEALAIRSLNRFLRLVDTIQDKENPGLRLLGVVPTFVGDHSTLAETVIRDMKRKGAPVLDASVPDSELFVRAAELGQPVKRLVGDHSAELGGVNALADSIEARIRREKSGDGEEDSSGYGTGGHYQQFRSNRFDEKLPIAVNEDMPGNGPVLELERLSLWGAFGANEWNGFLDAVLRASTAETAFVVDGEGLTITSRGRLGPGQVSGMGTRLSIAFEQARRMEIPGGRVENVLFEFEHLWMTGMALDEENDYSYTLGVLGREPVTPSMRKEIRGSLKALLDNYLRRVASGDAGEITAEALAEPIF